MKRVLIITYYWPPGGGAGVQRWLKFVKYLRDYQFEPVIYTPSNPENPVEDITLSRDIPPGLEVLKTPIWEPYDWYKRFVGRKPSEKINTGFLSEKKKGGMTEKIAVWLRGNLFIPDARKYWIRPSVKFLDDYLMQHPVSAVISTGPPHSMHLIALQLKKRLNIPWLADFRDPWTNIDFYRDLMLTAAADRKHHLLEREVLATADAVITVGETMKKEFEQLSGRPVTVITNGFDDDDSYKGPLNPDRKFSLAHIGTLVKSRNPAVLWEALKELVSSRPDFAKDLEIKLVGKVDVHVLEDLKTNGLESYLSKIDYLSHDEVIRVQQQSQVLLLLLNDTPNARGILTGKLFEYLASGRPVLCIGPEDGDAAGVIRQTGCGQVVNFKDQHKMKEVVLNYYESFKSGILHPAAHDIESYSRKSLTGKLALVLNSILH